MKPAFFNDGINVVPFGCRSTRGPGTPLTYLQKGAMTMEQMVTLISELGFPIVVTLFLLNRIEAKLDVVVSSIQGLPDRLKE